MGVILTPIILSISVNITSVLLCMKTLGELVTVQKGTQKYGVIAHLMLMKFQNPAQENGLVTILNGLPLLISVGMIKMEMDKSMDLITLEIFLDYMNLVILMVMI